MAPTAPRLVAWLMALAAGAATAQGVGEQRARIEREQAAAEARYAEREAVCLQQFIVTACVNEAKAERRAVLERLRNERLALDEQQRKQRAANRLADVEKRRQERAQAEREAAGRVAERASSPAARASVPAVPLPPPAAASAVTPRSAPDRSGERARAAERAAQQAQRASAAQEHRRRVEERNRRDPPPPSLPVPRQLPASAP
ncbi:hypothetical protein [Aquincola tertiaricarbonis]|uniref:hypothetical protein n=1 Tax=Aquincola tertiaricarbonis TaxID=391953 RepID=UPI000614B7D4|nr:hypothetical protein [Aquincola tertiaricarbonis]